MGVHMVQRLSGAADMAFCIHREVSRDRRSVLIMFYGAQRLSLHEMSEGRYISLASVDGHCQRPLGPHATRPGPDAHVSNEHCYPYC